ncbi:MAG: S9 family peptidase [Bacteroidetes bacterium]|nr:MAG: S9 family peptidase [Bacteroidota bacterium]
MKNLYSTLNYRTLVAAFLLLSFSLGSTQISKAQKAELTLKDIWKTYSYSPKSVAGFRAMNDGESYVQLRRDTSGEMQIRRYSIKDGSDLGKIIGAKDITWDAGTFDISNFTFSQDETKLLFLSNLNQIYRHSYSSFFYVYDLKTTQLIPYEAQVMYPSFSPDGEKVAYVQDNNLFVLEINTGTSYQITKDGKQNSIINGAVDWVYEEEFSMSRGFEWSPDSKYIAYYRFDESKVKEFSMDMFEALYPRQEQWKYPKAGEDNSVVEVHIASFNSNSKVKCETGENTDIYLPRIKWTNRPGVLSIQRLNRLQNKWELLFSSASDGKSEVVYTEESKTYVDISDNLDFVEDGFYFTSERSGWNHIWFYDLKKKKAKDMTPQKWDVDHYYGYDAVANKIYFSAANESAIHRSVMSVSLKSGKVEVLSGKAGWNSARFSKGYKYYLHTWSNATTPPVYTLCDANGKEIRSLEQNAALAEKLAKTQMGQISFAQLTTADQLSLNYYKILPPNFDASKKYPVLMFVYGGPGSQTVKDAWGGSNYMWFNYMASKGYIVVSVDNRGTGFRGEEFKKSTYLQLGNLEIQDQIAAAKVLAKESYVDASRIGIWGWSFGGYMASLGISKGADVFKTAVAVAPVTNWRYYDNIYTERFMRTPQENGESYDQNSPLSHVDKIKGNYLIVHGTADDNVHFQNAVEMVKAMIAADVRYDSEFYPNKNHGIGGGNTRFHLFNRITDYLLENL